MRPGDHAILKARTLMRRICLAALWMARAAYPQSKVIDFNPHGWYAYFGDHKIAGRWGLHFDGQWRRADLGLKWQQLLIRPAVNYRISERVSLSFGYGFIETHPYGEFPANATFPEHRIYQQAIIRQNPKAARIQHRLRLEQRFVRYPINDPPSWTYQNRFRYMFRSDFPLTKRPDGTAEWYVPVWDEIFLGIPPNIGARSYDQNRLFAGVGRSFGDFKIELGYMNQLVGQRNGRIFEFNNTLSVSLHSDVALGKLFRRN